MTAIGLSRLFLSAILLLSIGACIQKTKPVPIEQTSEESAVKHAKGFSIKKNDSYTTIEVTAPWPGFEKSFKYALVPREKLPTISLPRDAFDAIVPVPVERAVITSTTHIPALESFGMLHTLVGFPETDYISSTAARILVENGQIQELGNNENINTEIALALKPDVIFGFGIDDSNKAYGAIQLSGIPVVYNGDWVEQTPLGKAEWIKFFAPFFQKEQEAEQIFETIVKDYQEAKSLAQKSQQRPSVVTGGLYKDVWYVAGGKSWMAQFLEDANAKYLWEHTNETGSIGLSLEVVLEKAKMADYWLNPSMHRSYMELENANGHYTQFEAFKQQKVYSNAIKSGAKGGLLFYELAPQRPDLVLKDLISILHPDLLTDYETHFFMPLE